MGMQKQTSCSNSAGSRLLQNCFDLASMSSIGEVGDKAWRQTDLLLWFLRVWLFLEKLSDEVSNWMSLFHSWISSML